MMMSHPINPHLVIQMLKANGIKKVKLFDADAWTLSSLGGAQIETMVAIPNNQLASTAAHYKRAKNWVKHKVSKYYYDYRVDIRYVTVGNEPFLTSYNGLYIDSTLPALLNIQRALNELGLGTKIKATVPLNADVYTSPQGNPVPSAGHFRNDIRALMDQIVHYLNFTGAPFIVNIYPFLNLYQNPNFPIDFAFFDGTKKPIKDKGLTYTNVFDANFDTLVWSLKKAGVPDMKIIVGEVGWPTDGDQNANIKNARRFYDGFLRKMANKTGTPKRPGKIESYLFGLIDENKKSVLPGNFERHWGLFTYDGKPKFLMDLSGKGQDKYLVGAKGVEYLPAKWFVVSNIGEERYGELLASTNFACTTADCTKLGYGASCNGMTQNGNALYAFNMYFQMNDQDVKACDFGGLAKITEKNASHGNCLFPVQICRGASQKEERSPTNPKCDIWISPIWGVEVCLEKLGLDDTLQGFGHVLSLATTLCTLGTIHVHDKQQKIINYTILKIWMFNQMVDVSSHKSFDFNGDTSFMSLICSILYIWMYSEIFQKKILKMILLSSGLASVIFLFLISSLPIEIDMKTCFCAVLDLVASLISLAGALLINNWEITYNDLYFSMVVMLASFMAIDFRSSRALLIINILNMLVSVAYTVINFRGIKVKEEVEWTDVEDREILLI